MQLKFELHSKIPLV